MVVGIGDTSLKTGDKAVGGVILFLTNSSMTRASLIYWKAKQIDRVCHSLKDAETLNLLTMVEDSVYAASQLEQMLYGDVLRRIPICLFTDSESTLESIASSNQIVTKTLRIVIMDLKERFLSGEITSIAWLPTRNMWEDLLTKESKLPEALEDVLFRNDMDIKDTTINEVKAHGQEVRMTNIQNRINPDVSTNCDPTV